MQKKYRTLIIIATSILVIFGIIMIYSASYIWADYKFNDSLKYLKQQSLFAIIGFILMFLIKILILLKQMKMGDMQRDLILEHVML